MLHTKGANSQRYSLEKYRRLCDPLFAHKSRGTQQLFASCRKLPLLHGVNAFLSGESGAGRPRHLQRVPTLRRLDEQSDVKGTLLSVIVEHAMPDPQSQQDHRTRSWAPVLREPSFGAFRFLMARSCTVQDQ
jgi:hypothetical protein